MMDIRKQLFGSNTWRILKALSADVPRNGIEIGKRTDITYSHLYRILVELQNEGLVRLWKEGRENKIIVTDFAVTLINQIKKAEEMFDDAY